MTAPNFLGIRHFNGFEHVAVCVVIGRIHDFFVVNVIVRKVTIVMDRFINTACINTAPTCVVTVQMSFGGNVHTPGGNVALAQHLQRRHHFVVLTPNGQSAHDNGGVVLHDQSTTVRYVQCFKHICVCIFMVGSGKRTKRDHGIATNG